MNLSDSSSATWWEMDVEAAVRLLKTDPKHGLEPAEAAKRLQEFGPNQLKEKKAVSPRKIFFEQFVDFIVWVLVGAAVVSGFLREWVDAIAIIAIVILNAVLGFIQEYRAGKALAALRRGHCQHYAVSNQPYRLE